MSCAIQNQLARILAEFEMTLERDVLQPLSRLSEVTLPADRSIPASSSQLPSPLIPPSPCLPPGRTASHPQTQEKPAEAGVRLEHPQEQVGATESGWVHAQVSPQRFEALPKLGGHCRAHWVQSAYLCTHLVGTHIVRRCARVPMCMCICICLCHLRVTSKPRVVMNSSPRSLDGRKTSLEVFPGAGGL